MPIAAKKPKLATKKPKAKPAPMQVVNSDTDDSEDSDVAPPEDGKIGKELFNCREF